VSGARFKYFPAPPGPDGALWADLKQLLVTRLTAASFKTIWKLLAQAPNMIKKAFTNRTLTKSFENCGLIPYDPKAIVRSHPDYSFISQAEADQIMDKCLPTLYAYFKEQGIVYKSKFDDILGRDKDLDNSPPKLTSKVLIECHTSRQRCCHMNSSGWQKYLLQAG